MNMILIEDGDVVSEGVARISGRRFEHLRDVLQIAGRGGVCKAGLRNGRIGAGRLLELGESEARLALDCRVEPPEALPVTLVAALPRPKSFRKVLHAAVSMGVKRIYFINAFKVDKSYWGTPLIGGDALDGEIRLALEQAVDTVWPEVYFRKLFKPFVEDELPGVIGREPCFVAHPGGAEACPAGFGGAATLCVGPEGGFTAYEVDMLTKAGGMAVTLGRRILRTEFAVTALLSRLYS